MNMTPENERTLHDIQLKSATVEHLGYRLCAENPEFIARVDQTQYGEPFLCGPFMFFDEPKLGWGVWVQFYSSGTCPGAFVAHVDAARTFDEAVRLSQRAIPVIAATTLDGNLEDESVETLAERMVNPALAALGFLHFVECDCRP